MNPLGFPKLVIHLTGALYCEQEAAIRVADETPHWPVL